jgi:hypothetical protein
MTQALDCSSIGPVTKARAVRRDALRGRPGVGVVCALTLYGSVASVLGVRDGFGEQDAYMLVVQLVNRLATLTFPDDQAEVAQHAELLGDGRLFHLHGTREIFDRARPRCEAAEDPHTAGRGQRLHGIRDLVGGFTAEMCEVDGVLSAHLHSIPQSMHNHA